MSVSSPELIVSRCKVASVDSPIAVFKTSDNRLDAVFAATTKTRRRLIGFDGMLALVGIYHKGIDSQAIMRDLNRALYE